MAREFIDGFESGSTDLWKSIGATIPGAADAATYGFIAGGTYCADCASTSKILMKALTPRDEYYFAFKVRLAAAPALTFSGGATSLGMVIIRPGQAVAAYRGGGRYYDNAFTSLVATGTSAQPSSGNILVEVWYKPHTDTGRFVVKVNGVTDIDFTGRTADSVVQVSGLVLSYGYFDDVVVDSAGWVGNTSVQAVTITGAGSTTQFTASAGANYTCVDEIPYADTDYVYTNTAGNADTYTVSDISAGTSSVKCVQVQARADYTGAATPVHLNLVVRSGGTDYPSADVAVTTAATSLCAVWVTDPATSSAWTATGVNSAEIGVKAKA